MPYRNQYMHAGSPYPTGQAPMAFDLSQQMAAITQQMVETRQQEIKEKKLKISESENAILSALDFKTLEGAGDQFALEQAERLNGLTDKWTRKWRDAGGILGTKDKLELLKDKRDIEQKLAVGSAEIAEFNEIQKILKTPNQQVYEYEPTAEAVTEYIKSGKLGTGGLINLPVLKKQPFGAKFESMFDPFVAQRAKTFTDDAEVIDRSTGQVSFKKSNKASVDTGIEYLKSTQEYQELYATDPAKAETLLGRMRLKYLSEPEEDKFISAIKPKGGGVSSATSARMSAKNQAIADFNSAVIGIANLDQDEMNLFSSEENKVGGLIRSKKKGKDYIEIVYNDPDKKPYPIPVPDKIYDDKSEEITPEGKIFYQKIWESYPPSLKQGITTVPMNELMNPKLAKSKEYREAEAKEVGILNEVIGNIGEKSSNDEVQSIVKSFKDKLGEDFPIEYTETGMFGGANGITFDGKFYSRKPGGKLSIAKDLKKAVEDYIGLSEPAKPGTVPSMFQ